MQPLTYIISDCDPHSANYTTSQTNLAASLAQAQRHGWTVEVWPAVNGLAVTPESWQAIGVQLLDRGAIVKRPGARGCWFSHWGLWQRCVDLDEPLVILEHDAYLTDIWPEHIDLTANVWKLHLPDGRGERVNTTTGEWSCGAWAYTITPPQARQLQAFSREHGAQAVDKQLGRAVIDWQYWSTDLAVHRPAVRKSTTSPKIY
jgi:hypothetical protein